MAGISPNIIFQNPDGKPLNELHFEVKENGIKTKIAALNKHWIVPNRGHTKYLPLPIENGKLCDDKLNDWLTEANWFNEEMEWLLELEHFRFWSNLLYDPGCIKSVVSFLQESTPSYIPLSSLINDELDLHLTIIATYTDILINVLKILCRMITNKETEGEWITVENLSELLYKNHLMTIPMIYDIVITYGKTNTDIIKRFIGTLFKIESKYMDELRESLKHICNTLTQIKNEIDGNTQDLDDLALYTLDVSTTIYLLFDLCPDVFIMHCLSMQFEQMITNFYETSISLLFKNIFTISGTSKSLNYLNMSRMALLYSYRLIIEFIIRQIQSNASDERKIESLMGIFQETLGDKSFIIDYQRMYPIQNDINQLKLSRKHLDMFNVNFIIEAYSSDVYMGTKNISDDDDDDDDNNNNNLNQATNGNKKNVKLLDEVEKVKRIEKRKEKFQNIIISSDIQNVLDVLPHLDPEFVRKLLTRYDNPELAITAVLEGNIPPDLETMDDATNTTTNEQRNKSKDNVNKIQNLLSEFNLEPNVIVKTGKGFPNNPKNLNALLNDKSHVNEFRNIYQQYGSYEETDLYDDEYDDSYDALADSETKVVKSFHNSAAKNVIMDDVDDDDEDDDDGDDIGQDDDENNHNGRNKSNDFCENPEVIRERMARARFHKYNARGGGGGGGGGGSGGGGSSGKPSQSMGSSNVVGKPKGQGQDASTLASRHRKDVNKSTRGNHNRRTGAAFKRNRGMIPS